MTYPPQGQPGLPGPQPPQPGGFPQQPGVFPQSGPQPQPPLGYPGAPQPQQGPQADPWGQSPGAFQQFPGQQFAPQPPRKKRTGLIIGIVAAVVVLVGGGVTALLLLTGGSTDDPASLAQAAVGTVNNRDAAGYAKLVCKTPSQSDIDDLAKTWKNASNLHASVAGEVKVTGDTAKVAVTVSYNGDSKTNDIPMKKQNNKWCIDDN